MNKESKMNYPSTAFPSWKGRGESVEEKKANNSITHSLPVTNIPPPPPPLPGKHYSLFRNSPQQHSGNPNQDRVAYCIYISVENRGKGRGQAKNARHRTVRKANGAEKLMYSTAKQSTSCGATIQRSCIFGGPIKSSPSIPSPSFSLLRLRILTPGFIASLAVRAGNSTVLWQAKDTLPRWQVAPAVINIIFFFPSFFLFRVYPFPFPFSFSPPLTSFLCAPFVSFATFFFLFPLLNARKIFRGAR